MQPRYMSKQVRNIIHWRQLAVLSRVLYRRRDYMRSLKAKLNRKRVLQARSKIGRQQSQTNLYQRRLWKDAQQLCWLVTCINI